MDGMMKEGGMKGKEDGTMVEEEDGTGYSCNSL